MLDRVVTFTLVSMAKLIRKFDVFLFIGDFMPEAR